LSYCPRSSLPANVLTYLAGRLAHLLPPRPPGCGGTPPLAVEVRLDAVGAVLLDGLSYRRAGRAVGISKTEVGDSMDLLLAKLVELGLCQPDGTFITTLADLRERLEEMAGCGEGVALDGLPACNAPGAGPTRRCCTTPSATPTPPRAWRCRASIATFCGWTGAGLEAATNTNLSCVGAGPSAGRHQRGEPAGPGVPGDGQGPPALARTHRGPPHHLPAHRATAGLQPPAGRAARPGRAGDRPPRQCLGATPLARAAVPRPGRLSRRWRSGLPGPVASPGTHVRRQKVVSSARHEMSVGGRSIRPHHRPRQRLCCTGWHRCRIQPNHRAPPSARGRLGPSHQRRPATVPAQRRRPLQPPARGVPRVVPPLGVRATSRKVAERSAFAASGLGSACAVTAWEGP